MATRYKGYSVSYICVCHTHIYYFDLDIQFISVTLVIMQKNRGLSITACSFGHVCWVNKYKCNIPSDIILNTLHIWTCLVHI